MFHPGNRAVALTCMLIAPLSFASSKSFAKTPQTATSMAQSPTPIVTVTPETLELEHTYTYPNETLEPPSPDRWDLRGELTGLREAPPYVILSATPKPERQLSHSKIGELYDRLIQRSETDSAAAETARWASYDPGTRDFFASKLPPLIVDQFPSENDPRTGMPVWNPVWLNAVRLAGQLKVVAAIQGLKRGLSKPPMFGAYDDCHGAGTMTSNAKLCNDVVARALADIGDPSVPVVARFLAKGDSTAKKRAMWILLNIDSPAAYKAMRDHLVSERDPAIKGWIQSTLDGSIHYHLVQ